MSFTTVFTNGGSQAVRIPQPFRFSTNRVSVQAFRGGILLMPVSDKPTLADVLAQCDALSAAEKGFLADRPCNEPAQEREIFT